MFPLLGLTVASCLGVEPNNCHFKGHQAATTSVGGLAVSTARSPLSAKVNLDIADFHERQGDREGSPAGTRGAGRGQRATHWCRR
jgi:hypothetical protein